MVKPPPFLIGLSLVFWGWQTGFEIAGAIMAFLLEAPRWIKARWEFSDEDFSRIWTFCTLLFLAATVYAFTANEGPNQFRTLFESPSVLTQRNAGTATARTAAALFRWLPMVFFLFAAAQAYSSREGVPIETISLILSRRWKKARKRGQNALSGQTVDVSYYYFGLCLFAASVHSSDESTGFFWGLTVLLAYALWWHRPRRFSPALWVLCFAVAITLGYVGQNGLSHIQSYLGNLNPWWLGNLGRGRHDPTRSRTDLGRVGRMKSSAKIVVRLQTEANGAPPGLLREASYRRFNGQTWFSDLSDRDYAPILEETPNSSCYQLLRGKTNNLKVTIGCYLDNNRSLLPLPPGSARLERLTAFTLAKNPLGGVLDEGPGVVVFDAMYGPGATIDSSPEPDDTVPNSREREMAALDQVLNEMQLSPTELAEPDITRAIKTINAFFNEKFSYSLFQEIRYSRTNETPLSRFLLKTRKGHCEYFATAGVLLLRRLGIPARYAVGWAVHEGTNGKFVVRQRDAHAWCLVWDEKHATWRDVDFTPSSWIQFEDTGQGRLQAVSDFFSRLGFELSKLRWGQTQLRLYLLIGVIPILMILLYQIVFRHRRRRRQDSRGTGRRIDWPGLDSEFYRVEKLLAENGLERAPGEPLATWLERSSRDALNFEIRELLRELLMLHYRYRFDPQGLQPEEREEFRAKVLACIEQLRLAPR